MVPVSCKYTGLYPSLLVLIHHLQVLRRLSLLVLKLLPGEESPQLALEILLVHVVVQLLSADLAVGLGLLHVGVDLLADADLNGLEEGEKKCRINKRADGYNGLGISERSDPG